MDKKGRPIALEPWPDGEVETEAHFVYCNYRELDERENSIGDARGLNESFAGYRIRQGGWHEHNH
jgi:hypothetical protein